MPHVIVTAEGPTDSGETPVMFRERVSARDFESGHFSAQLVQRIGWAVGDAAKAEHEQPERAPEPSAGPSAGVTAAQRAL